MAAIDVLSSVSDRLVGGMMFHSDHADLCRMYGIEWLAKLHDDGFLHDSKSLSRVHRKCILLTGLAVLNGRQERTHVLDRFKGKSAWDVVPTMEDVRDAMCDWTDWESSAMDTYRTAYRRLTDMGEVALAEEAKRLALDTEEELAEAKAIAHEMAVSGWDMPHVLCMR